MTFTRGEQAAPAWWVLVRLEWLLTTRTLFVGPQRKKNAKATSTRRKVSTGARWALWIFFAIVFHAIGLVTLTMPRTWQDTVLSRTSAMMFVAVLFTLLFSYAMSRVVTAFHERRDLDFLLSSPVEPRLVLAVRSAAIVVAATIAFGFFIYPFVNVGVIVGRFWVARIYLVVPLLALNATAFALVIADLVVRAIGVRRARVGLQIFSALIGASFYFFSQASNFLPQAVSSRMSRAMRDWVRVDDAPWPVEAVAAIARGDLLAWLLFVAISVGLFVAATGWARSRFVAIAQMPETSSSSRRVGRDEVDRAFERAFSRGLFRTLLTKEWRLVLRAPQLLSQVLLQVLYLLPLLFVSFRHRDASPQWTSAGIVAGITGITSMLATALAWLTVAAEDAPDLLAGSPHRRGTILSAKLTAAAVPPVALACVAAIGVATTRSLREAALVLGFSIAACVSAAILSAASPATGKRSDFQKRNAGRGVSAVVELFQYFIWAAAAGGAASGYWIVAVSCTALGCVMPAMRLPTALRQFDE